MRAQLLVEEIFWRMVNTGNAAQVDVKVKKNFFGKVQIRLTAEGAPYNPLDERISVDGGNRVRHEKLNEKIYFRNRQPATGNRG